MCNLRIEAGEDTEELLGFLTRSMDGQILDQTEIHRDFRPSTGLASEPITIGAIITVSVALMPGIIRIIERWMENKRQLEAFRIIADTALKSTDAGKVLASVEATHAQVSVSYGLVELPEQSQM